MDGGRVGVGGGVRAIGSTQGVNNNVRGTEWEGDGERKRGVEYITAMPFSQLD